MLQTILVNKFKLGADPEFLLLGRNDEIVYPSSVYSVGREIGSDGCLAEIRPKPGDSAYELTKHIAELLKKMPEKAHSYKWRAGGCMASSPMGGHLHFSRAGLPYRTRRDVERRIVHPLNRLTATLERLDILPQIECRHRRSYGYGGASSGVLRRGDIIETWEYRKMPSWLFHPRITFICIALAKLVAAEPEIYVKLSETGFKKLVKFVELFKEKDYDAAILHEKLFPAGLQKLKADPTADFKGFWQRWNPLE